MRNRFATNLRKWTLTLRSIAQSLSSEPVVLYTSRPKDDPVDSQLLEELLRSHSERLRIYKPAPELERKLELFCEQRRKVVGLAVKLENQLRSTLEEYYPVAIDLCAPAALRTAWRWTSFNVGQPSIHLKKLGQKLCDGSGSSSVAGKVTRPTTKLFTSTYLKNARKTVDGSPQILG
jgi:hypothetical protein